MSSHVRSKDVIVAGDWLIRKATDAGVNTEGWTVERGEGPRGTKTWLLTSPRKITDTANFIDLGYRNQTAVERLNRLYSDVVKHGADAFAPTVEVGWTPRGFQVYGDPVTTGHGETIRVYESSNAMGPHVWLSSTNHHGTEVRIELNEDNARELVAQLRTWLHGVPERWGN